MAAPVNGELIAAADNSAFPPLNKGKLEQQPLLGHTIQQPTKQTYNCNNSDLAEQKVVVKGFLQQKPKTPDSNCSHYTKKFSLVAAPITISTGVGGAGCALIKHFSTQLGLNDFESTLAGVALIFAAFIIGVTLTVLLCKMTSRNNFPGSNA
ncbi:hypothetical protein D5018_07980 [Parashewanella curva]|uniref:Uncharacterized protein n=1 Tax=Parashewanella curva TaxID=2338552 RepID=A0A3L8PXQ3_9GAMM|nr:hypothetical protein [Parashewanella curva]RLV60196.1 hypothetical protein D5018_07980 [Parashewanella curva]